MLFTRQQGDVEAFKITIRDLEAGQTIGRLMGFRSHVSGCVALALAFGAGGPSLASGQGSVERPLPAGLADSSIRSILAHARGNSQVLAVILRQRDRDQPRAKLDELADSLVAIALQNPSEVDSGRFTNATGALLAAGARRGEGTSYSGALERLIRIHQQYPPRLSGHSRVAEDMLRLADHNRAVDYVFRVATTSTDFGARYAMSAMLDDIRTNGRFTGTTDAEREALRIRLRALWERANGEQFLPGGGNGHAGAGKPSVLDGRAHLNLQVFAREQGWSR